MREARSSVDGVREGMVSRGRRALWGRWGGVGVVRLIVVIVIAADVLFVGMAGFSVWQSRRHHEERAEQATQNLAHALSGQMADAVEKIDLCVLTVGDEVERELGNGGIDGEKLNQFIRVQKGRVAMLDGLRVVDAEGVSAYGTEVKAGARLQVGDRDYFQKLKGDANAGLVISDPLKVRTTEQWGIVIARRVNGPHGEFAGVVHGTVTLKRLVEGFSLLDVGEKGSIALRDRGLRLIVRYPEPADFVEAVGKMNASPELQEAARRSPEGATYRTANAFDRVERTYSFVAVGKLPLYVVVGSAYDEYLSSWRWEAGMAGVLVGLFVAGTMVALGKVKRDLAVKRRTEEELYHAAWTDRLTGLPNRAMFHGRLERAIARAKEEEGYRFAVLFLDFDRFKMINDCLGHGAGDLLLKEISKRIKGAVRAGDAMCRDGDGNVAARLGGDEFVVLLEGIAKGANALVVAQRLLVAFGPAFEVGTHQVFTTASIGIVTSEMGAESAEDVLRDADNAMYAAKVAGGSRAVEFDKSMRERARRRMELEHGLRWAVVRGEMVVHYQPIVSLETGRLESLEALVRWKHPVHGMISPAEFMPVAEETDLILEVGAWVFKEAVGQFARWRMELGEEAMPGISVNLSRRQLMAPGLAEQLWAMAEDAGVPPCAIHLEVTESAIMSDVQVATLALKRLKGMGFRIDMDDFGTGYSSLASLHQFPIDVLKIDRTFVGNLGMGRDFVALVNAISMLAGNLNIAVVAEGVETREQLTMLQGLECQMAQGYYFARPMAGEDVREWVGRRAEVVGVMGAA